MFLATKHTLKYSNAIYNRLLGKIRDNLSFGNKVCIPLMAFLINYLLGSLTCESSVGGPCNENNPTPITGPTGPAFDGKTLGPNHP